MAVMGVILLVAALLVVRGRLMKLVFHRGGADLPPQGGEDAPSRQGHPVR